MIERKEVELPCGLLPVRQSHVYTSAKFISEYSQRPLDIHERTEKYLVVCLHDQQRHQGSHLGDSDSNLMIPGAKKRKPL